MISAIQLEDSQLRQRLDEFPQQLQRGIERGLRRATDLLRAAVSTLAASPAQAPLGAPSANPLGEFAASLTTEVTDASGTQSVTLNWTSPRGTVHNPMTDVGQGRYTATFNLQGAGERQISITASDTRGNTTTSPVKIIHVE